MIYKNISGFTTIFRFSQLCKKSRRAQTRDNRKHKLTVFSKFTGNKQIFMWQCDFVSYDMVFNLIQIKWFRIRLWFWKIVGSRPQTCKNIKQSEFGTCQTCLEAVQESRSSPVAVHKNKPFPKNYSLFPKLINSLFSKP